MNAQEPNAPLRQITNACAEAIREAIRETCPPTVRFYLCIWDPTPPEPGQGANLCIASDACLAGTIKAVSASLSGMIQNVKCGDGCDGTNRDGL